MIIICKGNDSPIKSGVVNFKENDLPIWSMIVICKEDDSPIRSEVFIRKRDDSPIRSEVVFCKEDDLPIGRLVVCDYASWRTPPSIPARTQTRYDVLYSSRDACARSAPNEARSATRAETSEHHDANQVENRKIGKCSFWPSLWGQFRVIMPIHIQLKYGSTIKLPYNGHST